MPDRENVIKGMEQFRADLKPFCGNHADWERFDAGLSMLKEQEAVVRCKDCKYAYLTDDGECKYCEMEKDDNDSLVERYRSWDWFCADGERK